MNKGGIFDQISLLENVNSYCFCCLYCQALINQKAIEAPGSKKKWWQFW
jgi:hypothetical protein